MSIFLFTPTSTIMDGTIERLAPGLSAYTIRQVMPGIGFCIVSATVTHRLAAPPAFHPDPASDQKIYTAVEDEVDSLVHGQAHQIYKSGLPRGFSYERQHRSTLVVDAIVSPVSVVVNTYALGLSHAECETNAVRP